LLEAERDDNDDDDTTEIVDKALIFPMADNAIFVVFNN
jgi:hypothetical protein